MKRSQAWFITLNSQSTDKRFLEPLKKVWTHILENMSKFSFGEKGGSILSVKEKSEAEIGPKTRKAHIHGFVEITSIGMISLNYSEIKKFVDKQLRRLPGFVACHFDAQLVKNYNAVQNIKDYIEKDVVEENIEDGDQFEKFEVV